MKFFSKSKKQEAKGGIKGARIFAASNYRVLVVIIVVGFLPMIKSSFPLNSSGRHRELFSIARARASAYS